MHPTGMQTCIEIEKLSWNVKEATNSLHSHSFFVFLIILCLSNRFCSEISITFIFTKKCYWKFFTFIHSIPIVIRLCSVLHFLLTNTCPGPVKIFKKVTAVYLICRAFLFVPILIRYLHLFEIFERIFSFLVVTRMLIIFCKKRFMVNISRK